jgi:hypothetical protein
MGVPLSGTISMLGLAQEALNGTYGSGTINGPISMYDLINGGNAGSGETYPAINQNCLPNPANRSYSSFTASIYGQLNCVNVFYSGSLGSLTNGSQLYSSNGGATNLTAGNYYVCDNITVFGCTENCANFIINSSNVVTANSAGVCCP